MTLAKTVTSSRFQYIQEWDDEFLSLFSHRYDYIWAEHPDPKGKVEWKTESRHPLSDRLVHQGAYLYGVRFGAETQYCLLDIDVGSIYHPKRDPFAVARILAALEPLGLVSAIACTSSYSGGIHLYFPFEQPQKTWELSLALQAVLENAGFKPTLGQLELFPNARLFVTEGTPNLYAAHRLPMQAGAYILSDAWELTNSNQTTFVQHWRFAQRRNDVSGKALQRLLKAARRKRYTLSGKADKFLNDLNADIEPGWSDFGQTNFLLGRITMRSYIFGHLLHACKPLAGKALVHDIVRVARSLPGYEDWCRHQSDLEHRAEEWAQCVEASHYFPFGQSKALPTELTHAKAETETFTWNQQRSQAARERIRQAIADLLNNGSLPSRATARFQALIRYGIGGGSLYRHRDLWHPSHLGLDSSQAIADVFTVSVEKTPDPSSSKTDSQLDCFGEASNWPSPQSLLSGNDGNDPSDKALSDLCTMLIAVVDGNHPAEPGTYQVIAEAQQVRREAQPLSLHDSVQQESLQAVARSARTQRLKAEAANQRQKTRMQTFLNSGDPILVAEALAWIQANPGVLEVSQPQLDLLTKHQPEATFVERSVILAAIESQKQRLTWSEQQVVHALQQRFGKSSLATLSDMELQHWLKLLKQTPIDQRRRTVD